MFCHHLPTVTCSNCRAYMQLNQPQQEQPKDYILPNHVQEPEQKEKHTLAMLMAEIKILGKLIADQGEQIKRVKEHQIALAKRIDYLEGAERR